MGGWIAKLELGDGRQAEDKFREHEVVSTTAFGFQRTTNIPKFNVYCSEFHRNGPTATERSNVLVPVRGLSLSTDLQA
jgi:hypothetical protein